jgi:glycosyltransferase involved in cell wall biosynthesis
MSLLRIKKICLVADIEFIKNKINRKLTIRDYLELLLFWTQSSFITFNLANTLYKRPSQKAAEVPYPIKIDVNLELKKNKFKDKKIIVFSGALREIYSIRDLIEISNRLPENFELHIYGKGDLYVELITAEKSNPKIRYFGFVTFEESIKKQTEAMFLVILFKGKLHHKLMFSNKLVEYLYTGTPVLIDSAEFIPKQLRDYVNVIDFQSENFENELMDLVKFKNYRKLLLKSLKGREFVQSMYNSDVFSEAMLRFINEIHKN